MFRTGNFANDGIIHLLVFFRAVNAAGYLEDGVCLEENVTDHGLHRSGYDSLDRYPCIMDEWTTYLSCDYSGIDVGEIFCGKVHQENEHPWNQNKSCPR